MNQDSTVEPQPVVQLVEHYVDNERDAAEKYTNRTPLDDSGIYSLHTLAARIYALGFTDGERAEQGRADGRYRRMRDAAQS